MGLITLSEYQTYTNSSNVASDALILTLIESVSEQVERYCDRKFAADDYAERAYVSVTYQTYRPRQYPINYVKMVGTEETALTLTNNSSTTAYTIDISNEIMRINDESLNTTTYDFSNSSADILTELETLIEGDVDIFVDVNTEVSQLSKLLEHRTITLDRSGSGTIDGIKAGGTVEVRDDTLFFESCGWYTIIYNAGYVTIPNDLKYTIAQMVKDVLSVSEGTVNTNIKSFSISNHSETFADNINWHDITIAYATVLDNYKRIYI